MTFTSRKFVSCKHGSREVVAQTGTTVYDSCHTHIISNCILLDQITLLCRFRKRVLSFFFSWQSHFLLILLIFDFSGQFSRFFIQSVTKDRRLKTFGGDSWRVYIRQGPSSLAPLVLDHNNGLYEVLFLVVVPGVYAAQVYLDYTLCDGLRDPPENWFVNGTNCREIETLMALCQAINFKSWIKKNPR